MSLEVIVVVCFMHICFFKQDKFKNFKRKWTDEKSDFDEKNERARSGVDET